MVQSTRSQEQKLPIERPLLLKIACISLKQKHASECVKIPTDCSNGCGLVITREEIGNHIENDCPFLIISCPYLSMGCNTKVMRKHMASHLQSSTEAHLALACVKLNNTQEKLANTKAELDKTQIQLSDTKTQLYNTQTQLNNSQETTVKLGKRVDKLERQLKEKVNEKQVNEAVDKVMQMKTAKRFIWKIENYSGKYRAAKREENINIKSDPFYTDSYGYKLELSLYPNGLKSGKNSHLSVYIHLLKGEYDAILPWPSKITVKITLIDQQPRETLQDNVEFCFTHTVAERPKGDSKNSRGFTQFVPQEKLMTKRYLEDDTLFLRVDISPTVGEMNSRPTSYRSPLAPESFFARFGRR